MKYLEIHNGSSTAATRGSGTARGARPGIIGRLVNAARGGIRGAVRGLRQGFRAR